MYTFSAVYYGGVNKTNYPFDTRQWLLAWTTKDKRRTHKKAIWTQWALNADLFAVKNRTNYMLILPANFAHILLGYLNETTN